MKSGKISIVVMLSLALGGFGRAELPSPDALVLSAPDRTGSTVGHGWIANEADNLCGISALKRVTKPARVNYNVLFEATPQVREMKRKRIEPESAEGKALRNGARTLITKASELVRKARGHCSIWKVIRHKDGRPIPDVTQHVLQRF